MELSRDWYGHSRVREICDLLAERSWYPDWEYGDKEALKQECQLLGELESYGINADRLQQLYSLIERFLFEYYKDLGEDSIIYWAPWPWQWEVPWPLSLLLRTPYANSIPSIRASKCLEEVQRYLRTPWMQTEALTNYLLERLLYGLSVPFLRDQQSPVFGGFLKARIAVPLLFVFALAAWYWPWLWLTVACLLVGPAAWALFRLRAERVLRLLGPLREEVRTGLYDGEELARRLRQAERRGAKVPSLVYSLLLRKFEAESETRSPRVSPEVEAH